MFSIKEKLFIAEKIQELLREMDHPCLSMKDNISFHLHVNGRNPIDFCDINNVTLRTIPTLVSLKREPISDPTIIHKPYKVAL